MAESIMAPVVDLPGRKPHCWSEIHNWSQSFSKMIRSMLLLMIGSKDTGW